LFPRVGTGSEGRQEETHGEHAAHMGALARCTAKPRSLGHPSTIHVY
jgi:hypothetical protein